MSEKEILILLEDLNQKAKETDFYEYGLPLISSQDALVLVVFKWLAKNNIKIDVEGE